MTLKEYFKERIFPLYFSVALIIVVLFFYFSFVNYSLDTNIYKDIQIKTAFSPEGDIKVFALAKNNLLANIPAIEGNSIPESGSLILGFAESEMMKEEKLFSKPGDSLNNFFGIDIAIGGTLRKTNSFIDDMYFLNKHDFGSILGEEAKMFIRFKSESEPKLFYYLPYSETPKFNASFLEGGFENYNNETIVLNKIYFPVIIGSKEAEMMKQEKLFSKPGDIVTGFFGKNIVIAGVLKETGTALDMAHIIPINETEFDK